MKGIYALRYIVLKEGGSIGIFFIKNKISFLEQYCTRSFSIYSSDTLLCAACKKENLG